jgi:hypothetical protein
MFTQLSLFDLPGTDLPRTDLPGAFDSVSPVAHLGNSNSQNGVVVTEAPTPVVPASDAVRPVRIYGETHRHDSIQPMGDLARLVIARYEMMARRREEMLRRKAENPRKSIRVLAS